MIRRSITVTNATGLHARPASAFVQTANKFKSSIFIEKAEKQLNAKSIISVLSGGIGKGTSVTLVIEGEDEAIAEKALVELFKTNFGE